MKKQVVLFLSLFCFLTLQASAQSFMKSELSVNVGTGFGVFNYGGNGTYGYSPPLSANVEYSITDHIGIGAFGGFLTRRYIATNDISRFNAVSYGARGTVHFSYILNELFNLGIKEDKLDLYGSALVGLQEIRWSNQNARPIGESDRRTWIYGPVGGAKYFFTETVGVFAEVGRGVHGSFTLGISGRL